MAYFNKIKNLRIRITSNEKKVSEEDVRIAINNGIEEILYKNIKKRFILKMN